MQVKWSYCQRNPCGGDEIKNTRDEKCEYFTHSALHSEPVILLLLPEVSGRTR